MVVDFRDGPDELDNGAKPALGSRSSRLSTHRCGTADISRTRSDVESAKEIGSTELRWAEVDSQETLDVLLSGHSWRLILRRGTPLIAAHASDNARPSLRNKAFVLRHRVRLSTASIAPTSITAQTCRDSRSRQIVVASNRRRWRFRYRHRGDRELASGTVRGAMDRAPRRQARKQRGFGRHLWLHKAQHPPH